MSDKPIIRLGPWYDRTIIPDPTREIGYIEEPTSFPQPPGGVDTNLNKNPINCSNWDSTRWRWKALERNSFYFDYDQDVPFDYYIRTLDAVGEDIVSDYSYSQYVGDRLEATTSGTTDFRFMYLAATPMSITLEYSVSTFVSEPQGGWEQNSISASISVIPEIGDNYNDTESFGGDFNPIPMGASVSGTHVLNLPDTIRPLWVIIQLHSASNIYGGGMSTVSGDLHLRISGVNVQEN